MIHFLFRRTCYPRDIKMLVWVQSRQTNHMGRKGASLALAGHTSSDVVTIKIPYGVDNLLHRPAVHPFFSYWVGQNWIWILSVEIGLRRLPVVVAVISVDAYSCLVFSDLTRRLEDAGIGVFWLHCFLVASKLGSSNQEVSPSTSKYTRVVLVRCRAWKCVPTAISGSVDISKAPGCHLLQEMSSQWNEFSVRVAKNYCKVCVSWNHRLSFCFWPIFNSINYSYIIKRMQTR